MNYAKQMKDPRWQRKRLEAMQADSFTCQMCFRHDKSLNVHHKKYIEGHLAWEYETNELITLCEDCHKKVHLEEKKTQYMLLILDNITDRIGKTVCL